jgi:membrane-associated phospholipid phosphatase
MQKTALFSVEATADTEVVRAVMNSVTKRWRPQDVFNRRSYSDTFFHSASHVGSSFPSGHTIVAVSVATVIARRYRSHRWVPWVAYGFAGAIGLSRITLRTHFPSDVVLGTVLGYAIARYEVLQNQ